MAKHFCDRILMEFEKIKTIYNEMLILRLYLIDLADHIITYKMLFFKCFREEIKNRRFVAKRQGGGFA